MPKPGGTRGDFRKIPRGTLAHFLYHEYRQRLDFLPGVGGIAPSTVMHLQGKDAPLEGGRPAMTASFEQRLEAIAWEDVAGALTWLGSLTKAIAPGAVLVKVLDYYMHYQLRQAEGVTVYELALDLDTSPRNISRWRDYAVSLLEDKLLAPRLPVAN